MKAQDKKSQTEVTRKRTYERDLLEKINQENEYVKKTKEKEEKKAEKEENLFAIHPSFEDKLVAKLMEQAHYEKDEDEVKPRTETLVITSAVPLSDYEKEKIVRTYVEKSGVLLRRIVTVVDPTLIIGVRIQTEGYYYEMTGKKTLRELKKYIKKNWAIEEELK